jgi:hypothetical protein
MMIYDQLLRWLVEEPKKKRNWQIKKKGELISQEKENERGSCQELKMRSAA